jgi:hypothetical protein
MSLLNVPRDDIRAPFRTLNKLLNRLPGDASRSMPAGAVLWGVVRREGLSDLDDPSAHAGLAQHAYPVDRDEEAVCGYRPPRRRNLFGSEPRVELAVASSLYNPACERCVAAVGVPGDAENDVMAAHETPVEAPPPLTPPALVNEEPLTAALSAPVKTYAREEPRAAVAEAGTNVALPTLRLGGVATVAPGSDSLTLRGRELRAGTAIVANLEGAPRGLRVVSVAVHGRGLASVVLNRKVERPVQVAWFVASPSAGGTRQRSSRAA